MAESQNGWRVLAESECKTWILTDVPWNVKLWNGPPGFFLAAWTSWFNANVEELSDSSIDDHGWGLRKIGGTNVWSNHSSGTAVDLNALQHPQGRRGTFSADQLKAIRAHLDFFEGVVKWGGDFRTTPDEMHFEIAGDRARCLELRPTIAASYHGKKVLRDSRA